MAESGNEKKNAKGKGRWSVADTFIVLLVILSVGGFAFRFVFAGWQAEKENKTLLYDVTFVIEDVHPATLSRIDAADTVYMYDQLTASEALGYIDTVTDEETGEQHAALSVVPAPEGSPVARVSAVGTLVCTGARFEDGFLMVDGCPQCLAPGTEITVCTERVMFTLKVTGIHARA